MPPDSLALWGRGYKQGLARGVAARRQKAAKVRVGRRLSPSWGISSPFGGRVATLTSGQFFVEYLNVLDSIEAGIYAGLAEVSERRCAHVTLLWWVLSHLTLVGTIS